LCFLKGALLPVINGIDYSDSFGGVFFSAGKAQQRKDEDEVAETLCPSADGQQPSTVFRDHLGRHPSKLTLSLLVPDAATYAALLALIGYPGYDLAFTQFTGVAELDSLTGGDRYLDQPQKVSAAFTILSESTPVAAAPPPRAGFVWSATALLVELDANQGTWSFDGVINRVDIEWGDSATDALIGPFGIGGIPSAFHEFAAPGTYVTTISVVASDEQRSADESQMVTVS
jgi:hypothetical protein